MMNDWFFEGWAGGCGVAWAMIGEVWGWTGGGLLAQGGGVGEALFGSMLIPLLLTMLLMYFLLMRPEQKKRKELERMLAGLKKNDHVVTIGGIFGTVVAASPDSKVVTIRIDDSTGTKVKILRSAISHITSPEEAEDASKAGA